MPHPQTEQCGVFRDPSLFTLFNLSLGHFQVMLSGNLPDQDEHAVVSVLRPALPLQLSSFLRLHRCRLHGNGATGRRWALLHLHDNCIRSEHHDGAGWAARTGGRGCPGSRPLIGRQVMWLFDVTASHWSEGNEGSENSCRSYFWVKKLSFRMLFYVM